MLSFVHTLCTLQGHLQEEPLEEGAGPLDEGAGPLDEGAVAVEELPNFLLLSGWEEHPTPPGPIVMMTPNHERYKCVVPQLTEESSEVRMESGCRVELAGTVPTWVGVLPFSTSYTGLQTQNKANSI